LGLLRYIGGVMTATLEERLGVGMDAIREFCEKWGIIEFALFGSVVRDDFGPDSDIDVMVSFDPERRPLGYAYVGAKLAIEDFLGRSVDMIEFGPIRNPYVRRSVERDLTVVYAA
jgi:predicted nucleotidyltransferase